QVDFPVVDGQGVFPDGYLPHVGPRPLQISHELDHRVEPDEAVAGMYEGNARLLPERVAKLVLADRSSGLDHREVGMAQVEGASAGHGDDVEPREDRLRIGSLMARHLR